MESHVTTSEIITLVRSYMKLPYNIWGGGFTFFPLFQMESSEGNMTRSGMQ